jgi:selenocysteine lyase/cysteine desulfurase
MAALYTRRDVSRLLALTGAAGFLSGTELRGRVVSPDEFDVNAAPLARTPPDPDERFWSDVRGKFLVPRDLNFLNAANLCPACLPAVEALERNMRRYEASPSPEIRSGLMATGREEARKILAEALRATPEEVVITRNTTEGNNFISSGLDLRAGDEVVVWADNHPSNLNAWRVKAQRFGFTVVTVPTVKAHPGTDGYVELFTKAFTPRTKIVAMTHVSSNSGDLLPVAEICAQARTRGILSLVDGAQAFGVIDVNLSEIKPDFYTGSMHKWPCGPKEKGLLFVARAVQDRVHPSVVGVYAGQVGISRTLEAQGQRDDAAMAAGTEALKFQGSVGRAAIEKRSRQLAQALMDGLKKLNGVTLWTDPNPARSAAIVIFQPGSLDVRKLSAALTENEHIVCTTRAGQEWPGLRMSPHFYNTMDEVDRALAAIQKYLSRGV